MSAIVSTTNQLDILNSNILEMKNKNSKQSQIFTHKTRPVHDPFSYSLNQSNPIFFFSFLFSFHMIKMSNLGQQKRTLPGESK